MMNVLSARSIKKLKEAGYTTLDDFQNVYFPDIYEIISFDQSKLLLILLIEKEIPYKFSAPQWSDDDWKDFIQNTVNDGILSWQEIGISMCGALNPPQVGTAVASNKSFQAKFPPRETMKNVMEWFYSEGGQCNTCGTRLHLEADHIKPKEIFVEEGHDIEDADTLDNLQLLCKRCNVIKRPSHKLGGISFAPAQSVLIWILLTEKPTTKAAFGTLCRQHGLTMASIRFDEAWAFAIWLSRSGDYKINEG